MYKFIGKKNKLYELDIDSMKLNYNCPADQKSGEGKGSCGGKVTDEKNSNSKDIIEPIFKSSAHIKEEIRPTGTTYYKIIDSKGNLVGGVPNNKNQAEKDLNRIIRKEERLHAKSNMLETKIEPKAESNILPKSETSNNIIKVKNLSNYNFHGTNNDKNATLYNIKQKNVIISDTIKNISTQDVENILEKIPLGMIRNIKSIEITDDKKSDNPNSLGTHVRGSGTITMYGLISTPEKLENTLYHEIGHQFDNDKGYDNYASRGTAYRNAVNNDKNGFISAYAKNQPIPEKQYREDFADSVREYLKDEVKFEKNYPNRTKFIRDKLNSIKQNSIVDNYQFYQKLNYNCPDSEKSGEGKGSCGGSQSDKKDSGKSTSKEAASKPPTMNARDIISRVQSGGKITKEEHAYITALINGEKKPKSAEPVSKPIPVSAPTVIQTVPKKELVSNTKKAVEKVKAEMKSGKVSQKSVNELKKAATELKEAKASKPKESKSSAAKESKAKLKTDNAIAVKAALNSTEQLWTTLNENQQKAVEHFSSIDYVPINSYLRTGKVENYDSSYVLDTKEVKDRIKNLDSVFDKVQLPENTTVYRGINMELLAQMKDQLVPGNTLEFKAFTSTTHDEDAAKTFARGSKNAIFEIRLPKGSKALSIEDHSGFKKESEILLNRGMKFKVAEVKTKNIHGGAFSNTRIILEAY